MDISLKFGRIIFFTKIIHHITCVILEDLSKDICITIYSFHKASRRTTYFWYIMIYLDSLWCLCIMRCAVIFNWTVKWSPLHCVYFLLTVHGIECIVLGQILKWKFWCTYTFWGSLTLKIKFYSGLSMCVSVCLLSAKHKNNK